jgi:uncharacterized protein YceK
MSRVAERIAVGVMTLAALWAVCGCSTVRVHHVGKDGAVTDLYYNSLGKDVDLSGAKIDGVAELQNAKGSTSQAVSDAAAAFKAIAERGK